MSAGGPSNQLPELRHGTGMLRRFGWFYKVLGFGRRLSNVRLEENSVDRIRAAMDKGPIVYVLKDASAADHLALNSVLNRRRLPLSVWSNGANSFWWQPVLDAWRDLWLRITEAREDPVASGWLARQIAAREAVTLFLRGRRLWSGGEGDAFQALLDAGELTSAPIQVIPVVVNWTRAPDVSNPTLSFLLGRGRAGVLGQLRNIWFRAEGTFVQVGEPLDLAEFRRRARQPAAVRVLRTILRRYIQRESQIARGPKLIPYQQLKRVVLNNPEIRKLAASEADRQGVDARTIRKQMESEYGLIAANFRWWVVRASDVALRIVWTRVFSGVDVRPEDVERMRDAMRSGSMVMVPCHKSHADYILLSWVAYDHNLIVPHVIAGANLAIWPISIFLRSVGGFFIKRRFAGERLHPAIFSRYLSELIFRGYPVEFYIEGGRTRSGKLLPPKVGVLGMVFNSAERRPHDHKVTLLPISLAYEQVAEEGAYTREAAGEEKRPESLGQVFKARSVLKRRFGRVYLRVGEPIDCATHVDRTSEQPAWSERTEADRKEHLQFVGEQIIHRIGEVAVVLPTCLCAAALLAHHRRGIRATELAGRVDRFRTFLRDRGAPEAASIQQLEVVIRTAMDRFGRAGHVEATEVEGERVWSVVPGSRIPLEFYKNQVVHHFALAGFVTLVVRGSGADRMPIGDVVSGFERIQGLLHREFVFDPARTSSERAMAGVEALVGHGALRVEDDQVVVDQPERMGEIYQMFRNFAEAYRLILQLPEEVQQHTSRTLPKHLSERGPELLAAGIVSRNESVSTITLGNAIRGWLDLGVVRPGPDDKLVFDTDARDAWLPLLTTMGG